MVATSLKKLDLLLLLLQERHLTKKFYQKTRCEFCEHKLLEQQKKVGYQISKKQYLCLKCSLEKNFITDQEIISFIKSKIPEIKISQQEKQLRYYRY